MAVIHPPVPFLYRKITVKLHVFLNTRIVQGEKVKPYTMGTSVLVSGGGHGLHPLPQYLLGKVR